MPISTTPLYSKQVVLYLESCSPKHCTCNFIAHYLLKTCVEMRMMVETRTFKVSNELGLIFTTEPLPQSCVSKLTLVLTINKISKSFSAYTLSFSWQHIPMKALFYQHNHTQQSFVLKSWPHSCCGSVSTLQRSFQSSIRLTHR